MEEDGGWAWAEGTAESRMNGEDVKQEGNV